MTRLAAQKKLQYYPSPESVTDLILAHLQFPDDERIVSLLDPCAGEGIALAEVRRIARKWGATPITHVVELDKLRARLCQEKRFTQVAQANAAGDVRYAKHNYDLLWFNPPYDYDPEAGRLEAKFFAKIITERRALAPGGVFIGLLPKTSIRYLWADLRDYLDELVVAKFPAEEYTQFHQVVVLGRMVKSKRRQDDLSRLDDTALQARIEAEEIPFLDELPLTLVYEVPSRITPPTPLGVNVFQPDQAFAMTQKQGWMTRVTFADLFWPAPQPQVESLLPLRPTFVGVAVAGGLFNNIPLMINGRLVLVKGMTRKVESLARTKEVVKRNGDVVIQDTTVEQFVPMVIELGMRDGEITRYQLPVKTVTKEEGRGA